MTKLTPFGQSNTMRSLIVLVAIFVTIAHGQRCNDGWTEYGTSCFSYFNILESFVDAVRLCETMGGAHLADIANKLENTFVKNYMNMQNSAGTSGVWIGGNDKLIEGMYVWDRTGEAITYFDWNATQPDDTGSKAQDCMALYKTASFRWIDHYCDVKFGVLCEQPAQ